MLCRELYNTHNKYLKKQINIQKLVAFHKICSIITYISAKIIKNMLKITKTNGENLKYVTYMGREFYGKGKNRAGIFGRT